MNMCTLRIFPIMMLMVFNTNPVDNANYLIANTKKGFVFKSLLELAQLVSTVTNNGIYKPVKQGVELVSWIKKYPKWTAEYYNALYEWCKVNVNMKDKTNNDFNNILKSLEVLTNTDESRIKTAFFRYSQKYTSNIPTKTELPIEICISEYKRYIDWKMS